MQTLLSCGGAVLHIEVDMLDDTKLLIAIQNSVASSNGSTPQILSGSRSNHGYLENTGTDSLFNHITDFVQMDLNTIIVVDYYNHCLRLIDRGNNYQTEQFAGTCGLSDTFRNPIGIMKDKRSNHTLLVADHYNYRIHQVDTKTRITKTVLPKSELGLRYLADLAYDYRNEHILISSGHRISRHDESLQVTLNIIAGSTSHGYMDGTLNETRFFYPRNMVALSDDIIIVADRHNNRLRVLNTAADHSSSICTGQLVSTNGMADSCSLRNPTSLLLLDGHLLIGESGAIRSIPGELTLTYVYMPYNNCHEFFFTCQSGLTGQIMGYNKKSKLGF